MIILRSLGHTSRKVLLNNHTKNLPNITGHQLIKMCELQAVTCIDVLNIVVIGTLTIVPFH